MKGGFQEGISLVLAAIYIGVPWRSMAGRSCRDSFRKRERRRRRAQEGQCANQMSVMGVETSSTDI
jgi:hypothetical protein